MLLWDDVGPPILRSAGTGLGFLPRLAKDSGGGGGGGTAVAWAPLFREILEESKVVETTRMSPNQEGTGHWIPGR